MIRLGVRLAVAGGRAAVSRLALVGAAVAVGVALLLGTLAGLHAVSAQNLRYAWLNSGVTAAATGPEAADPAGWAIRGDYYHGRRIARVDVAATGPGSPVPPGAPRLPAPGEFFVSPALAELLATAPAGELAGRWPGRQAAVLGDAALPSPDSLIVLVGRTPDEVARIRGATVITRIVTVDPADCSDCLVGIGSDGLTLVLAVAAAALLFPLLIFIGTATRLSAARRERRLAAMRLVGATPRQVAALATAEAAVAAAAGTLLGFVLFPLVRLGVAEIPFTGERFFPADLSLTPGDVLLVGLGVPLAAAAAGRVALRRVRISPLGVSRRVTPRPPRAWRLLPPAAGLAELAWFVGRRPETTTGQLTAYLSGIFVLMAGLLLAGPWLTMAGSRLLARRAGRPATLIAGRRLADDPRTAFRAVSGLMLALFVATVATGVITTLVFHRGDASPGTAVQANLTLSWFPDDRPAGWAAPTVADIPAGLRSVPGVRDVLTTRFQEITPGHLSALVSCADLARHPELGGCPPGAAVAETFADLLGPDGGPATVWPAATVTPGEFATHPLLSVVVVTDGSQAALEPARTVLATAFPDDGTAVTEAEWRSDFARTLVQFQRLADVAIVASLVVAGCSLAVAVSGGITERARPFSLLRLAGVRLAELGRVVLLETVVPLLAVATLAIGAGLLAAHLFLRSQLDYSLRPPAAGYYLTVAAGLALSVALIVSTLPLLRRVTGPAAARGE